jgi:hypothetical protein
MKAFASAMVLSAALAASFAQAQPTPGIPMSEGFDGVTPPRR